VLFSRHILLIGDAVFIVGYGLVLAYLQLVVISPIYKAEDTVYMGLSKAFTIADAAIFQSFEKTPPAVYRHVHCLFRREIRLTALSKAFQLLQLV
jgi:hypothetical protein